MSFYSYTRMLLTGLALAALVIGVFTASPDPACPLADPTTSCKKPEPVRCDVKTNDCPCGSVCCPTICSGTQCYAKKFTASKEKRGECPFFDRRFVKCATTPDKCSSDADCATDCKCCQLLCGGKICMAAAPVVIKPGCCPKAPECTKESYVTSDYRECTADGVCPDGQKCCIGECGSYSCINPV